MIAEAVRSVQGLSGKVKLSAEERAFVNEQAAQLSDQVMRAWAERRYRRREKLRPCCVSLAVALALDVAHKMARPGENLSN